MTSTIDKKRENSRTKSQADMDKEDSASRPQSHPIIAQGVDNVSKPKLMNGYSGSRDRVTSNTSLNQYKFGYRIY